MTQTADETPEQRLARWTSTDAAIGLAAEVEQLRAQLAERQREVDDLRVRLTQLANRLAQAEAADNAGPRRAARPISLTAGQAVRRVYHRGRAIATRLRR